MDRNRGLSFLVGIFSLYLLWQFRNAAILEELYFQQYEQTYGTPIGSVGAVIVSFVIEAIIAIGAVVILVATGIWQALVVVFGLLKDTMEVSKSYLVEGQKSAESGIDVLKAKQEDREAKILPGGSEPEEEPSIPQVGDPYPQPAVQAPPTAAPAPITAEEEIIILRAALQAKNQELQQVEDYYSDAFTFGDEEPELQFADDVPVADLDLTDKVIESLELNVGYSVGELRAYAADEGNFEALPVIGTKKSDEILKLIS